MIVRTGNLPPETGSSSCPVPRTLPHGRIRWWPIPVAAALTPYGAFTEELAPGAQTAQRHWQAAQDDACRRPDIDLHYSRQDGVRATSHKVGPPCPGWPKETTR